MKKIVEILTFPIKWFFILIIYLYKILISPLLTNNCIYTPTCSTYAIQAFKKHGIIKGFYFTAKRILRCRPSQKGGLDFVLPNIKGEDKWIF